MKKKKISFVSLLTGFLAVALLCFPFGLGEIHVRAESLESIESEINELVGKRDQVRQQMQDSESVLSDLNANKVKSESDLAWLNERSAEQREAYQKLREEQDAILLVQATQLENLNTAMKQFELKKEQYGDRIQSMFGMQHKSILELLLEAESLQGFFTTVRFMKIITDADEQALADLREAHQKLIDLTEQTKDTVKTNDDRLAAIQSELDKLKTDEEYHASAIADYTYAINEANNQVSSFQEQEREIQKQINAAQTRYGEVEAEQQRQAALAAQRQANSAQQNNAAGNDNAQGSPGSAPAPYTGGAMLWPTPGVYQITAYFGYRTIESIGYSDFHTGLDIGAASGHPVVAAASGTVIFSQWMEYGGNAVMIDHGGGVVSLYCHLSGYACSYGQQVNAGDTIAYVGSTGFSTGPHLHFEVRVNGVSTDPLNYLQ